MEYKSRGCRCDALCGAARRLQPAASVACLAGARAATPHIAAIFGKRLKRWGSTGSWSPGGLAGPGAGGGSRESLDLRYSLAAAAGDYTKRKHVLRVTCAAGAELLLQADSPEHAARWLRALRAHAASPAPLPHPPGSECSEESAEWPAPAGLSPLPPQRTKKISRNRSPTGPSPPALPSSPKSKTWKGRMARQLRRMQGGGGGGGATTGSPATCLGAALERCTPSADYAPVPLAVAACAGAIESRGLHTVGVYRVPGNAAGVTALAAAFDRGEPPDADDPRWADVHVVSSLLKAFFRRLPDSLLTSELYPAFIAADQAPERGQRARALRRLLRALPDVHYETLKFLVLHLRRVAAESAFNKMEARNLAIVFGPTLVRGADDDVMTMVNDMSSQCRIIESLIEHCDWYFDDEDAGSPEDVPADERAPASAAISANRELLITNAKKIEGKDVSPRDIVSSIISAANRKIQRKPRSKPSDLKKGAAPHAAPVPLAPPSSLAQHTPTHAQHRLEAGRGAAERAANSLHTFSIDDGSGDLVSSLTNTFDQKLRTLNNSSPLDDDGIPYADEGPEQDEPGASHSRSHSSLSSTGSSDRRAKECFNNCKRFEAGKAKLADEEEDEDSEKENYESTKRCSVTEKEKKGKDKYPEKKKHDFSETEKDIDTVTGDIGENMPDNDKCLEKLLLDAVAENVLRQSNPECAKRNSTALEDSNKPEEGARPNGECKLKRSESLNREPERAPRSRVLRSESLNCKDAGGRLRRADSLTKTEKTECNMLKRRELNAGSNYRATKLKRKNGMPERSIKRRHTLGGTQDLEGATPSERRRTSSPDLTAAPPALLRPLESHV